MTRKRKQRKFNKRTGELKGIKAPNNKGVAYLPSAKTIAIPQVPSTTRNRMTTMSNTGNQATFFLPQEPIHHSTYTLIRKKGKRSVERIHFRYDRKQGSYVAQYRPTNDIAITTLAYAHSVANAIERLAKVGYIFQPR